MADAPSALVCFSFLGGAVGRWWRALQGEGKWGSATPESCPRTSVCRSLPPACCVEVVPTFRGPGLSPCLTPKLTLFQLGRSQSQSALSGHLRGVLLQLKGLGGGQPLCGQSTDFQKPRCVRRLPQLSSRPALGSPWRPLFPVRG